MFTGIIETIGTIAAAEPMGAGRRFRIASTIAHELHPDQSVAINGACLTVVAADTDTFTVEVVEETLRKTTLGTWEPGLTVNLERAVRAGDRLDGHIVQGHVDTTLEVVQVVEETAGRLVTFHYPETWGSYLIPRGSIALDGISLTVARLEADTFSVALIPYTLTHTNAHTWQPGMRVNAEFDLVGKYVVRHLKGLQLHG